MSGKISDIWPRKTSSPCGEKEESRFSPDFEVPLSSMEIQVQGDPNFPREISCVQILNGHQRTFEGPEKVFLDDFMAFIKVHNPDAVLFPYADTWIPLMVRRARRYGIEPTLSRTGRFKSMASKSYWSYGKVNHKDGAMIPEGRVLIDTAKSFVHNEGELKGILNGFQTIGLSPNLIAASLLARSSPPTKSSRPCEEA
jgi:DNA polymerase, archaea type